jgi:hypothetical protein
MGYVTSNMINLNGPLTQIFIGLLMAITGCVLMITSPSLDHAAFLLFVVAGVLMALAILTLAKD